jgi:hypothetical protein
MAMPYYLPYLPWSKEMILSMLDHPRWPKQVQSRVPVAGIIGDVANLNET